MATTTTIKKYLGDGVYAEYEPDGIMLTTEDGINVTNRIYLEPKVFFNNRALIQFFEGTQPKKTIKG